jgi:hypothetical protein
MAEGGVSKLRGASPSSVFEAATGYLPATPSKIAEDSELESHTLSSAPCLANRCSVLATLSSNLLVPPPGIEPGPIGRLRRS